MKKLFNFLKANNYTISSCESFTGGLFGSDLSNIPGASTVYKGGFICYSDEFKINQLGIEPEIIKKYSSVSIEALKEMLHKTKNILNTDVVVGFTGYATPIDLHNQRSGLSYVGFLLKDEVFLFELNIYKNISRKKYKKKALNLLLTKIKNKLGIT
ncbi:CinA family protein [Spiroplasma apis]|uniref:Competence damage-inducible protein A n=1 Tax=Spiroplasma apis B31 TaxID=1276258 RepID=V5RJ73_SPIAP|nr:nicotinamide-nucleotide amidohydrolase family protein [Spiroplasma apis]AHB36156.1 competence damage-inducible protein A [Spiroplasma apis B31]